MPLNVIGAGSGRTGTVSLKLALEEQRSSIPSCATSSGAVR
jgi:hypothetical protein